jgi:hypothetical protein
MHGNNIADHTPFWMKNHDDWTALDGTGRLAPAQQMPVIVGFWTAWTAWTALLPLRKRGSIEQ